MVAHVIQHHGLSERRSCRLVGLSRSVYQYSAEICSDQVIIAELEQLAERKPTWGFWKMFHWLRNHGHPWNHKRVYRIYRDMRLHLRVKPKKRLPTRERRPLEQPEDRNHSWAIDFMSDSLTSGRPFRTLNILDEFNRQVLWIEIDTSLPSARVIRVLDMLTAWHGFPKQLRSDNGPEFIAQKMAIWAAQHEVEWVFIQPGKPAQNAYMERFNRTYRQEVLDAYLFEDLAEVRAITEIWIEEYNGMRPHQALGGQTPYQFAQTGRRDSTFEWP